MRKRSALAVIGTLAALLLAVAGAHGLTYEFRDGKLSGPEAVAVNGFQQLEFENGTDTDADLSIMRLHDGVSTQEFLAADGVVDAAFATGDMESGTKAVGALLALADAVGGVQLPGGTQGSAYIQLEPGTYVLKGSRGGSPGQPTVASYLTVNVSSGERGQEPTADLDLHLKDFHFDFPEAVAAGQQLWRVSNTGSQPHIGLIFKLAEGKTADDALAWMADEGGPPPVEFGPNSSAFIQTITAGQTFYLPVNLTPGTYVAVCPLPNLASGEPHFMDGMVSTFTVR